MTGDGIAAGVRPDVEIITRTRWLSAAAYSGMFGFGIVISMLGAVLPFLMQRIGFDIAAAGTLFLPMNATMLILTFAIGPLLDRFGMKPPLVAGPILVSAALIMMAGAQSYGSLMAAVVVLGAGGAALNSTTNTLIADLHSDPRRKNAALNLLGVFFGAGALFVPFTIGSLIHTLGLQRILWGVIALVLVSSLIAAAQRFPEPKQHGLRLADSSRFAKNPVVLLLAFLLFFESGNEFILSGFTTTYLTGDVHLADTTASYLLAGLWGATLLARIASSRILLVLRGESLIAAGAAGTVVGVALLMLAHGPVLAAFATIAIGFCSSAIFPTTLGLAAARFEKHSGSVFGILIAVSLLGGMTLPWVLGHLASRFTLRAALSIVMIDALAIVALLLIYRRTSNRIAV